MVRRLPISVHAQNAVTIDDPVKMLVAIQETGVGPRVVFSTSRNIAL